MTDIPAAGAAVELRGVSKRYGIGKNQSVKAADNIDLSIPAGAFVAVTGASGSGKSTLLHLIGAIDRPDSGTIVSNGEQVTCLHGSATMGVLTEMAGKPDAGRLFLFAIGGVTAFALLEALLAALRTSAPQPPEQAFPFAGALNAASVCAALGMATLVAHFVRSPLAWFLAQMSTTAIYMLVVAVEVTIAAAVLRRPSHLR